MTIHVVSHRTWLAEYLNAEHDNGFDLIDTGDFVEGEDAIWAPGHYASLMRMSGADWLFDDAIWWNLTDELLGRKVKYTDLRGAVNELTDIEKFVKLARHKYEQFPAKVRDLESFKDDVHMSSCSNEYGFIISDIIDLETEYRVWVIDGEVRGYSKYRDGDVFWGDDEYLLQTPLPDEAKRVVEEAAKHIGLRAIVVDVGETTDGKTLVVETNPPWSSGFYDVDPKVIREAVLLSQGRTMEGSFIPDPAVETRLMYSPLIRNSRIQRIQLPSDG